MSLAAWLRRRIERPGLARPLLAAALAACTIVPPWLAGRSRLAADSPAFRGAGIGGPSSFTPGSTPGISPTVSDRRSFDA
jgi:hypothetical protein